MTERAFILTSILTVASCTLPKTPYVSEAREPNDVPPSPRYRVVWMALRDELPRQGTKGEFYLCQGPEQVAVLQRDLPASTLRHASETCTAPVKDWPGLNWSHRRSDDALATRVTIDIDTATADTITTTLWIGHQAPNLPPSAPHLVPHRLHLEARETRRRGGDPELSQGSLRIVLLDSVERPIGTGVGWWSHRDGCVGLPG
jgi:hypothetical protein